MGKEIFCGFDASEISKTSEERTFVNFFRKQKWFEKKAKIMLFVSKDVFVDLTTKI